MQNPVEFSIDLAGKTITLQAGHVAQQANGAVLASLGGTVVLSVAVGSPEPKENAAFFPLTVDYRERTYATGRIPGGFFRREGRPREAEILSSRVTDRTLRPLFPEGYYHEIFIQSLVLSSDGENDADVLAALAASAALTISNIPFKGPSATARVGRVGGQFVINPTFAESAESDLDLVVSATKDAIVMVEGSAKMVPEENLLEALQFALGPLQRLCDLQIQMRERLGQPKTEFTPVSRNPELDKAIREKYASAVADNVHKHPGKKAQEEQVRLWVKEAKEVFEAKYPDHLGQISGIIGDIFYHQVREMLMREGVRADGRKPSEIRAISTQVAPLPRTHGSAMFQRGQTQSLAAVTLGTPKDMQSMEELEGDYKERFLFHYNFPGWSSGEVRPDRGPGRREIGHGSLARRALLAVLPKEEDFPYTIRVVSDILESNGSSSMASVCAGSLALFDAGVPLEDHVAGVAMGLVIEKNRHVVLTDITGLEDHLGDMDFKLAGTRLGATAFQMDVKVPGVTMEILKEAVEQAKNARLTILDKMIQAMTHPRSSLSLYAPKMVVVQIPEEKIGALIGPGGKNIRRLSETYGIEIEVEDDGRVFIHAKDWEGVEQAKREVEAMTQEPEVGKIYKGKVVSLMDFGAFVEIFPGRDGLLHVSQMGDHPVGHPGDVLQEGQEIEVKVLEVDPSGKIRLSRKAVLNPGSELESPPRRSGGGGGFRQGGGRGGGNSFSSGPRGFGLRPPRGGMSGRGPGGGHGPRRHGPGRGLH